MLTSSRQRSPDMSACCASAESHATHDLMHSMHRDPSKTETATDPVCGMTVNVGVDTPKAEHRRRTYYFCGRKCREKFTAEPDRYLKAPEQPKQEAAAPGVKWTCPMHPQIVRDAPGSCPICGMALEPMTPTLSTGPNPELLDMQRRFLVGLALTVPVLALEMGRHVLMLDQWIDPKTGNWLQLL